MLKIALVHDHLVQDGGAEKVLKAFCELYPKSPIFTIVYDKNGTNSFFVDKVVKTSYIQKIPGGVKNYQWYLSLMPSAVENQCLDDYDLIISSASSFAKGVITRPGVKHICYCHTPTRYLWNDSHNYLRELKVHWLIKKILPLTLNKLRLWDRLAAERVDYFIANSQTVSERIKKYYNREAVVIYPPVDIDRFKISNSPKQYFLAGGRLVAYKRFDLIVKAFSRLGIPVKIFGIGPELSYLKKIAKLNVEFLGKIDDAKKIELYSNCLAYINPQEEDFGITTIEAMASGRPVIAYHAGGAKETVLDGITGEFFEEQIWEDLAESILRFDESKYNPEVIREHAEKFSVDNFKLKFKEFIDSL
jgi:glycosyltransferase involved in cell wall biosynthesis